MVPAPKPPGLETDSPAQAAEGRQYYSISQAAALLGVSRMSLWRWILAGRLPVTRLGTAPSVFAAETSSGWPPRERPRAPARP